MASVVGVQLRAGIGGNFGAVKAAMGPLQDIWETWARFWTPENPAVAFVQARWRLMLAISAMVVVPCFWHRRIEAGDLGSHVYNVWLAQLIAKGQAPGLYSAHQWHNMLFDLSLLHATNTFGFVAAQRIVVSVCVLIFFWGVFALICAVTEKAPLYLTPCMAMLAYGYSFEMGFMNYYLSVGLACFSLAIFMSAKKRGWIVAVFVAALVYMAHPLGFLWLAGTWAYLWVRSRLTAGWRAAPLAAGLVAVYFVYWELVHRAKFDIDWDKMPFYQANGADQLVVFGDRYVWLAWGGLAIGLVCFLVGLWDARKDWGALRILALPLELYAITFFATALLPENLRASMFAGWIGLLVSRLTTISAILGLCVLGGFRAKRWHLAAFGALTIAFFSFLFKDTKTMNELESNAEKIAAALPYGTRVIPTIQAPPDWRVQFIGHTVDRACIGHCFNYANYEPSSGQFRVRVEKGSPLATDSSDDSEDMEGGSYEVQDTDPPLMIVYQCDATDFTSLCMSAMVEGQTTGQFAPRKPAP
jgi:hypothetical protein